jgi:hypothetical protein
MAKKKFLEMTSPRGRAVWPHLHAPDTKFDANGTYSTGLMLEPNAANAAFITSLDKAVDEAVAAAKQELIDTGKAAHAKRVERAECYEEQEDGSYKINFKLSAGGERKDGSKWEQRPKLYDAQGKVVKDIRVGGGSLIRVAFYLKPYYMPSTKKAGVSLRIMAVQIIDLQEYGGDTRNAEGFGFAKEDGFTAPEEQKTPFSDEAEGGAAEESDEELDF